MSREPTQTRTACLHVGDVEGRSARISSWQTPSPTAAATTSTVRVFACSFEPLLWIAAEIRERLGHPVIDCDAHVIEYLPLVRGLRRRGRRRGGGSGVRRRHSVNGGGRASAAGSPPATRCDAAAVVGPGGQLPRPCDGDAPSTAPVAARRGRRRLCVPLPTHGMLALHVPTPRPAPPRRGRSTALRSRSCWGARRVEPVAVVPAYTPDEALAALAHTVEELGLKAVVMTGLVPRIAEGAGAARRLRRARARRGP